MANNKGGEPKAAASTWVKGVADSRIRELLEARAAGRGPTGVHGTGPVSAASFLYMRPLCKGPDCPDGGGNPSPGDPCRGIPYVWPPAVAVRAFSPTSDHACPTQATLDQIRLAVVNNLSSFHFPQPDVRVACEGMPGLITVLIWPTS